MGVGLNFEGLVAAAFTPIRPDGAVDLEAVGPLAESLASAGVRGAFVCGTTGEGPSLSTAERQQVAERWCRVAPSLGRGGGTGAGDFPVIVHVGHASLAEAKALAAHAQSVRAAAVAAIAPYFFKPATADDLVAFCAEVAAAAPAVPFYYYHFPDITDVRIPASEFLEKARRRIPTLAGLKFTDDNLAELGQCLEAGGGNWDVFFGREEMMLGALSLGVRAHVGGSFNYTARIYRRVIKAFARGDLPAAREAQSAGRRAYEAVRRLGGGVAAMKAVMKLTGPDCGPPRPPLRPLSRDESDALRQDLERAGFFAAAAK